MAGGFQPSDIPISIIKRLEPVYPHVEEITLHGWGEGTLHPGFTEILKYFNTYPLLRKYFVTNGSTLPKIQESIFDYHVDLVAVSLDGATAATNDSIRKGCSFQREITSLKKLIAKKTNNNFDYPYVNFVFTAMQTNIHELPDMISLAGNIGVPEVKVVYLTVFDKKLLNESLMGKHAVVRKAFDEAKKRAGDIGIKLKLPEIQGEDNTEGHRHKLCSFPWRDLFIGSDGYIRLCQSSAEKLGRLAEYESFDDVWNSEKMQHYRKSVNNDDIMPAQCFHCYHSTCANWNLKHSFIQINRNFVTHWGKT
jgi:radical SAM protein with 4Fe4S-binding SPASM domain